MSRSKKHKNKNKTHHHHKAPEMKTEIHNKEIEKQSETHHKGKELDWMDCAMYMLFAGQAGFILVGTLNLMYIADQLKAGVVYTDFEMKLYNYGGMVLGAASGLLTGYGFFRDAKSKEQMENDKPQYIQTHTSKCA